MTKLKILYALLRVALPEPLVRLLYGERLPQVRDRQTDPKAQAVRDLVALVRDPDAQPTVEESRAQLATFVRKFDRPCPGSVQTRDITLPGAEGPRAARLYLPKGVEETQGMPTLFYLHGGGWIQGSIDTHDGLCGKLADRAGIRVISYDYRLAPEHRFPAAPDDVIAGYLGLLDAEAGLGLAPGRLAVGGDSAGANLAASLLHSLGESGQPMPAAQILIYPGIDGRLASQSMQDLQDDPVLSVPRISWYLDQYLPERQDRSAPRVSPLFSPHLADQPPALVVAAGQDPLWDDGVAYARALSDAGVPVHFLPYPGQVHGFFNLTRVIPQGDAAITATADWLRATLRGGSA